MKTPPFRPSKKTRRSPRRRPPRRRASELRAPHKRATHPQFIECCSIAALPQLPIAICSESEPDSCPRRAFRSRYRPRSRRSAYRLLARLKADRSWRPSWFELALYLVDFSALRPRLLSLTLTPSRRGEMPFDPLSLLLACLWKVDQGLPWTTAAQRLAHPGNGAHWRTLLGFSQDTPKASTLRAFRDRLPVGWLNQVQQLFLAALQRAGLLPSTDPHGYIIAGDGQLHQARSRHRCHQAVDTCLQPAPRPCPADQATAGKYGCACDTPACQERCALAARLDPQARYIVYAHKEKKQGQQTIVHIDKAVFGYRSMAARLVDPRFHCAWNVHTDLFPANADEGTHFPAHFRSAYANLPQQKIGDVLYDSACGEQACLDVVYDLGGIPLFDLRAAGGDDQARHWIARGYDDHGHLLCPWGHRLSFQGIDYSRPRARWVCGHRCRQSPQGEVRACPYLSNKRGYYAYVTRTLPDDTYRLARLVPHGTALWKRRTRWRNTSESRNSSLESKGLLRLPDYGLAHAAFLILAADVLENLATLARLVYEATMQDERFRPLAEREPAPAPLLPLPASPQEGEPMLVEEAPPG